MKSSIMMSLLLVLLASCSPAKARGCDTFSFDADIVEQPAIPEDVLADGMARDLQFFFGEVFKNAEENICLVDMDVEYLEGGAFTVDVAVANPGSGEVERERLEFNRFHSSGTPRVIAEYLSRHVSRLQNSEVPEGELAVTLLEELCDWASEDGVNNYPSIVENLKIAASKGVVVGRKSEIQNQQCSFSECAFLLRMRGLVYMEHSKDMMVAQGMAGDILGLYLLKTYGIARSGIYRVLPKSPTNWGLGGYVYDPSGSQAKYRLHTKKLVLGPLLPKVTVVSKTLWHGDARVAELRYVRPLGKYWKEQFRKSDRCQTSLWGFSRVPKTGDRP